MFLWLLDVWLHICLAVVKVSCAVPCCLCGCTVCSVCKRPQVSVKRPDSINGPFISFYVIQFLVVHFRESEKPDKHISRQQEICRWEYIPENVFYQLLFFPVVSYSTILLPFLSGSPSGGIKPVCLPLKTLLSWKTSSNQEQWINKHIF